MGRQLAYCAKFDQLPVAMKAVKPTVFVAVPRVYEKIRQAVEGEVGCVAGEAEDFELGAGSGEGASGGDSGGKDAECAELEDCEQAGVLEDSRGVWRARRRCLSRVGRRWGWIRRDGLRMWGFGSLKGMG